MKFRCLICRKNNYKVIATKTRDSNHKIVVCKACSHIQMFPLPNRAEEKEFYNKDIQSKLIYKKLDPKILEQKLKPDNKRRAEALFAVCKSKSSVLDVGCGYGFFLKELHENGFKNIEGVEVSRDRRRAAKKIVNVPIWSFKIEGNNKTNKLFSFVTFFHVLEHSRNPVVIARDLKSYLKKDGTLIIEIPNANDYLIKFSKPYKNFFWQIAHLNYFTQKSLKSVITQAGYSNIKIKGVQRYGILNALNWVRYGKPQLHNPSYSASSILLYFEKIYKIILEKLLICDTLWIEAKIN